MKDRKVEEVLLRGGWIAGGGGQVKRVKEGEYV
jgi:hypothetical protein